MKNDSSLYYAISIVILVSLQYLLMSSTFNDIANSLVGDNPFMSIFGTLNNMILFLFPILTFIFLVISTSFMLDYFDIKNVSSTEVMSLIGLSMVPLLFGMIFYNMSIVFFMKENPQEIGDVANLHFLFNLQIKDFGFINKLCWILTYYLIFSFLYFKHKVSIRKSLLSTLTPTLLFFLFSYIIKSI